MTNKQIAVFTVLLSVGILLFGGAVAAQRTPMPMGADGTISAAPTISWSMILSLLGGGSFMTAIMTLLKKAAPTIEELLAKYLGNLRSLDNKVEEIKRQTTETLPVNPPVEQAVEVIAAAVSFVEKREDKARRRRFVTAVCTEFADMEEFKKPAVATPLNGLMQAVSGVWFPIPTEK